MIQKFRAYDTVNESMSDGVMLDWFITGEPTDMEFGPDKDGETGSLPLNDFKFYRNDYIITQSTCLFDKNGKEIYVGDIIQKPNCLPQEVVYYEGAYRATPPNIYNPDFLQYVFDVEVIGNIYQNPELLEVY